MKSKYELLVEALDKRGYLNQDLVDEIVQIYGREQLSIHGVVKSLPTKEDATIEIDKLREQKREDGYREGVVRGMTWGFKQGYNWTRKELLK
tara:strand:+ start:254 stop:529 length:276 start_codon:yes stop_codon:yes gene_type:complete